MFKQLIYTFFISFIITIISLSWDKIELAIEQSKKGELVRISSVFGSLNGQTGVTRGGRKFYKFNSIPYAIPPIDNLRFEDPIEFGKWEGELDATKPSPACPQVEITRQIIFGQEDCLYLSVYTPSIRPKKPLPVMVFFYGGYYMFGSDELYGPEYLLDEEIVLVVFNWRTNILGFFSTGTQGGNQGLKDQLKVLQWVNKSISSFGGDSQSITLFGNSAGAASVSYHMVSNLSKGLFHRAISQSGTNLCSWAINVNPREQLFGFGRKLGCPTQTTEQLVDCLKKLPVDQLMNAHLEILNVYSGKDSLFVPTIEYVDDNTDLSQTFLTESPRKLMLEGKFHHVPWINGVTENEGCFKSVFVVNDPEKLQELNENWDTSMANLNLLPNDPEILEEIRKEYFPTNQSTQEARAISWDDLRNVTNVIGDHWFYGCARESTIYHSKHAPVYLYYFGKKPEIGYGYITEALMLPLPAFLGTLLYYLKFILYNHLLGWEVDQHGVCHTDELQQLFLLSPVLSIPQKSERFEFSNDMVKLWVSFAKNGKPDQFRGVQWNSYDGRGPLMYLRLSENPVMIEEPFTSRVEFWSSLNLPKI